MVFVKRVSSLSIAALAFAAVYHGAVLVHWRLFHVEIVPYEHFQTIYPLLLAASFGLSVALFAVAELHVYRILLVAKLVVLAGIAQPFAVSTHIGPMALYGAIVEICAYEEYPINAFESVAAVVLVLTAKLHSILAATALDAIRELTIYALSSAAVIFGASLLTRYRQMMIACRSQLARLETVVANLSDANRSYLQLARASEARSAREERNRITRELHDSIGYSFTNLIMMIQAAKALEGVDSERLRGTLDAACEQAQLGLAETRRSLHLLRESEVSEPQGHLAIHKLVRTFQQATGVSVEVDYANMPPSCGAEIDSFIYHFVQEGLTNSFRHGKATRIRLIFWYGEESIKAELWDNGIGAGDTIVEGIGMLGMREQLGKLGGTLEARNVDDGFEVRAEIPLRE